MPQTRTRASRTPAAHADKTRSRILEAAVKTFSDKGFEGASTRAIARAAGLEQGVLTYHFRTKDALWRAAAERVFRVLRTSVAERVASLEEGDTAERSREAIRQYVRTMAAHPEFFRFIVDQGGQADARTRWLVDTQIKPGVEVMKQLGVLSAAQDEDAIPHALFALLGAGSLIFAVPHNCRRLTGLDPKKPDAIQAHAEFVANLMVPPAR
jgi:TetR/AcrR family transcriptional regulator